MKFVLDASVALSWCFEDEGGDYALRVLEGLRHGEAVVSSLWPLEVTNGLATAERMKRLDAAAAAEARRLLQALPIVVDPVERRRAFEPTTSFARSHALSTYDASYLELAWRLGIPLATLDGALRGAASAVGVAHFL